jgi:hypothetical protein
MPLKDRSSGEERTMTNVPSLRASVVSLACGAALLVAPVPPLTGLEEERHVILVNALDRDGNQVPGLSAANFRGEYRSQPVTIVSVIPDKNPRRVVVLVDPSSPAADSPEWRAAEELVRTLTPQHRMVISTLFRSHCEMTSDLEALERALRTAITYRPRVSKDGVPIEGRLPIKSLKEGVMVASSQFMEPRLDGVLFLFSNGYDPLIPELQTVVKSVAQTGVRVFVVRTPGRDQKVAGWMASMAEATGGSVNRLEGFQKELPSLHSMITDAYRLEMAFPQPVDEPRKWKLEAIGPGGKRLPKVRLVYPQLVAPLVRPK